MSSIILCLIALMAFSFRGRFVCLKVTDTERSMRHVLNFKNKKAVPQHCFYSYRESGLVQQLIYGMDRIFNFMMVDIISIPKKKLILIVILFSISIIAP